MKNTPSINQDKSAARLYAVQALFQIEASGQGVDAVLSEFENHWFGALIDEAEQVEGDSDLFHELVCRAVNEQARVDQLIDRALAAAWPINRIDPTLRALFRAAGAELAGTGTCPKVVISEYAGIARMFFPEPQPSEDAAQSESGDAGKDVASDGKAAKFVIAVLDHMAREAQPEAF